VCDFVDQKGRPVKVVIVGQGYVGLPVAMRAVDVGHTVVGLEKDARRAARLAAADSFVEDVSDAALSAALATERYLPTSVTDEAKDFDVAVITVPTPLHDGAPDLSFIEIAAEELAPLVTAGSTVILESTTYPGTTEELMVPILEKGSGLVAGRDFHVGYSPERIDPGNQTYTFVNTPKVVAGIDAGSLAAVKDFYASLVTQVVVAKGCKEAEMTKLIENTFRHVNVALVNELAIFANELGIDVWDSIDAASTKPFGFMRFTPGPGVGGHCLPIDPSYLSWRVKQSLNRQFRFVELANDINEHMPQYVVNRITVLLNSLTKSVNGSRVLLLGLAYKKNSSDVRESPAVRVAALLLELGANVCAVEPFLDEVPKSLAGVSLVDLSRDEVDLADLVVVLTDHDQFDFDMVAAGETIVLDTRHRLPSGLLVEAL
jgi:UDP-N-acetyl-D-glucosamine dehydrogenase